MFLGHFGVAFAGKRAAPSVSLGTLFLAVQFADLLFFPLVLSGVEHFRIVPGYLAASAFEFYDYPVSHSLLGLAVWGILFAAVYALSHKGPAVAAVVLAIGVVSHWFLDVVVHAPDVPVMPKGPYLGLVLWGSIRATVVLEVGLLGLGLFLYLRGTRAMNRTGTVALWALVALIVAIWLGSLFGPPPPNVRMVAWSSLALWLFVPWGYWIDRHRAMVQARQEARP